MSTSRSAFRFFLNHAGYSLPPGRAACALALARAERALEASDLEVVISPETDPDLSFYQDREYWKRHAHEHGEPEIRSARALREAGADLHPADQDHEVVVVSIVRPCPDHGLDCRHAEYLASVGNVVDADREYLRVLRAELASELSADELSAS